MKQRIVLDKNKFLYKGKCYDEISILKLIGKKVEFVILEEDIFIKPFDNMNTPNEYILKDIIKTEYGDNLDILTHYEYDKNLRKLILYSINNGNRIDRVSEKVNSMVVIPIQFYIKDFVYKKLNKILKKEKYYKIISNINDKIYLIDIENGFIIKSKIEERRDFSFTDITNKFKNNIKIIIDENIKKELKEDLVKNLNIHWVKMEKVINERLF